MNADVIVVGSGPGGVNAAAAMVDAGVNVMMLDVGDRDCEYKGAVPRDTFTNIRRTDPNQHRFMLGARFEGIGFGKVRVGAQLTPPRKYVQSDRDEVPNDASSTFAAMESLARGGLGAAWGAGAFAFEDAECASLGLTRQDLQPHYEAVAQRIGVCDADDDLSPFFGSIQGTLPSLRPDTNAESVLDRYAQRRSALNATGFFLGHPRLAVCTQPHAGRGPAPYDDLDFWSDHNRSVYRPQWTLNELEGRSCFDYLDRQLVLEFEEAENGVRVGAINVDSGERMSFAARFLVLAAGTLGTARIVLRSTNQYDLPVPLLCNPYTYVPTVNLNMIGKSARDARTSLAQLTAILRATEPKGDPQALPLQAALYSYRSLLLFKLVKEAPVATPEAIRVMRALSNLFAILGIHHPDFASPNKTVRLCRSSIATEDQLRIDYEWTRDERRRADRRERQLLGCFRKLGCWPIKRIRPGHGSSIRYAGTFPIDATMRPRTCDSAGRLRGTQRVHLADGSVFRFLPAKGVTFTLMAHAQRVGAELARVCRCTIEIRRAS